MRCRTQVNDSNLAPGLQFVLTAGRTRKYNNSSAPLAVLSSAVVGLVLIACSGTSDRSTESSQMCSEPDSSDAETLARRQLIAETNELVVDPDDLDALQFELCRVLAEIRNTHPATQDIHPRTLNHADSILPYVPGEILIEMAPGLAARVDRVGNRGDILAEDRRTGNTEFDRLNRKVGLRAIGPTLVGHLTTFYIDPNTNIVAAAEAYEEIDGIVRALPNAALSLIDVHPADIQASRQADAWYVSFDPGSSFGSLTHPSKRMLHFRYSDQGIERLKGVIIMQDRSYSFQGEDPHITIPAGEQVTYRLVNAGVAVHNMHVTDTDDVHAQQVCEVDGPSIGCSEPNMIPEGEDGTITIQIDEPGVYSFRCDFHPIEMIGTITVR